MHRTRKRDMAVLSLYGLALSLAANTLDPPVLTAKVNQLLGDTGWRNAALGLVSFLGMALAAFAQPVLGALSDRSRARWGRRIPFLVGGTLANLVLLPLVALAGNVWLLGGLMLLLQLSSNAIQGAYQGLIPDQVPPEQHGVAAGIKSLAELPTVIIGPLAAGLILGLSGWSLTARALAALGIVQAVYVAVMLLTLWRVRDRPLEEPGDLPGVWRTVRDTFRIDWRANRDLRWWLVNRALFWFALLTLRTFLINYVEQVVGLSPDEAQRVTGVLSALLGILVFVLVLPSGYIADRVGRKPLLMASGLAAAAGAFVLLAARSIPLMFGAGVLIGVGGGFFITSSWALVTNLAPPGQAARFLGITNLATAGGSAAARLMGPLIDALNHLSGSQTLGYASVYALGGLLFLLSSWAIWHVSEGKGVSTGM